MKGIKIEIHPEFGELGNYVTTFLLIFFGIYTGLAIKSLPETGVAAVVIGIIIFAPPTVYGVLFYSRPMIIRSDGVTLRYKHIFRTHEINLSEISGISCEPYERHSRYSSMQRIRLVIKLKNAEWDEIEFNDRLNTSELVNEKLNKSTAEIPLIRLYDFLRERIPDDKA